VSERESREEICPDCQATEFNKDSRIIMAKKNEVTGEYYTVVTWHTDDCPKHTIDRILMADGARKVKEQDEWAREALPAAFDRIRQAAAAARGDAAAAPFAEALVALVAQQAEDLGCFVPPYRWAKVLEQYFPPAGEAPSS